MHSCLPQPVHTLDLGHIVEWQATLLLHAPTIDDAMKSAVILWESAVATLQLYRAKAYGQ